ncbi:unnamed protein product [Mytilus coruscus]|uniref:G-protein coupled receptors family 1 profile domain-containing protein n=1 Tax=Mytilus coruscus TaxID=42192 RepID=A0A6J8E4T8_MYTCO|nr:unnamed protein product [Mytilus coruscus]
MSSANITDTHAELVRLNDEKALFYLPVIIYMLILMFVGTFGNILVCCVYLSKQTKTSSHYFILALAMLDLLTCLVGMPTEVADLRYPYMFYAPAACLVIWKRKRTRIGEKLPDTPTSKERPSSDGVSNDPISTEMSSGNDGSWESERRKSTISARNFKKQSSKNQIKVTRTTVVLFAVTVAYVISFLPFLIVMVLRSTKKDFEESLSSAGEMLYKFCSKSYFINNAINPCIYSFLNINFRKDTKNLMKRILASCCCRNRGGTTV